MPVVRIEWSRDGAAVFIARTDGQPRLAFEARTVIVTIPLGVLKAPAGEPGAIEFVPPLRQKQAALEHLDTGSALRVALRLREPIWEPQQHALSFLHTTDSDFPVWWTSYPQRRLLIVCWCGGVTARRLSQLAPGEIESRAITALGRQFRLPPRRIQSLVEAAWHHNWQHDPFARGAYSYQMVGGADAPATLARPLGGTLFFAGEASNGEGGTGTVEGAIETGERAAKQVLRVIQ
jgi:monoamine oxidase